MKTTTSSAPADAHEELEAAKKAVLDAYANFLEAKKHLQKAALTAGVEFRDSANEHIDEAVMRVRAQKNEYQDLAGDYVRAYPFASTGIAFVSGMILTRLLGK